MLNIFLSNKFIYNVAISEIRFEVSQLHYLLTEEFFLNPLISKLTTVYIVQYRNKPKEWVPVDF